MEQTLPSSPDVLPDVLADVLEDAAEELPADLTLSETLQRLAQELIHCAETLRETHELVAPQLAELERRYPTALTNYNDQRSLGRASSSYPA